MKQTTHITFFLLIIIVGTIFSADMAAMSPNSVESDTAFEIQSNAEVSVDQSQRYTLNFGDQLLIEIYGVEKSKRVVTVNNEGEVSYQLVGTIKAVGKTIDQLEDDMNTVISRLLRHAIITIVPLKFGSQYYTIMGQVPKPGKKLIQGKTSLLSAVSIAGGSTIGTFRNTTVDLANLDRSFLLRNGEYLPVNFEKLIEKGDQSQNETLQNGDYIFVASILKQSIYIIGEINFARTFTFIDNISLIELLARARGLTPNAGSRLVIIRGSIAKPEKIVLNVKRILNGEDSDVLLQPGDIVYVPPRSLKQLEDVFKEGIRSFVSVIASEAGSYTFRQVKPNATATQKNLSILP